MLIQWQKGRKALDEEEDEEDMEERVYNQEDLKGLEHRLQQKEMRSKLVCQAVGISVACYGLKSFVQLVRLHLQPLLKNSQTLTKPIHEHVSTLISIFHSAISEFPFLEFQYS